MLTGKRFSTVRYIIIPSLMFLMIFAVLSLLQRDGFASDHVAWVGQTANDTKPVTTDPNCWKEVTTPNIDSTNIVISGIAAQSDSDVWAVGYYTSADVEHTLVEHWDGISWSIIPTPDAGTSGAFSAIGVAGATDIWAVGWYINGTEQTLTEHWDGRNWSIVPTPNPGQPHQSLNGITVIAANDVWAVGQYADGYASDITLTEHWDGSAWSVIPSPNIEEPVPNYLTGVSAVSSDDVWAVGFRYGCEARPCLLKTLTEHWDGTSWSIARSIDPVNGDDFFTGVAAVSANDIWAVGAGNGTLIEHWNGTEWSVVPSPNVGSLPNGLSGVSVVAPNDVWAVGQYYSQSQPRVSYIKTLIEHWNGRVWSVVSSPNPGIDDNTLQAVSALSANDVWAAGAKRTGDNRHTLVERYTSCVPTTGTPTVIPTLEPPPCAGEHFTDVCPGDYFYTQTLALVNDNIINGYNTSPPCPNELWIACFRPYNSSTRGQISKVVALAADFTDPVLTQTFEDVLPGSTFYTYTERMAEHGIIGGYPCGGTNEPCVAPENRPYFRPSSIVTRGQLSKMVALAFGWSYTPMQQAFEDVVPDSTFYTYVGQLYTREIINGYPCGSPGEACTPPDNLPYFRPNNSVTRGQTAKIVQLARIQPTPMPTATVEATATDTPTATSTVPVATDTPAPTFTFTPTSTATPASR